MQTIVSSRKQGASLIRTVKVVGAGSENSLFNPRFALRKDKFLTESRLDQGGSWCGRKEVRRTVWVAHRERVRDRFGLKVHSRLCTCVDTSLDHSTHYPVQVGRPDGGEYDAEDGDKVGYKKDVGTI
jgi:hypothetical protein